MKLMITLIASLILLTGCPDDKAPAPQPPPSSDNPTEPKPTPEPPQTKVWPSDANTGVANCPDFETKKKSEGRIDTKQDGQVIEYVDMTSTLNVKHKDVIVRCSRINNTAWYGIHIHSGGSVTIEDVEISGMKSAGIYGSNFKAHRVYVHNTGADAFKPSSNFEILDSYATNLGYISDSHSDGVQMVGGQNGLIKGNNFQMPKGVDGYTHSQVFMIAPKNGPVENIVIRDNLVNGGGYTFNIRSENGMNPQVVVKNNLIGRDYRFGPKVLDGDQVVWENNMWSDTGEVIQ